MNKGKNYFRASLIIVVLFLSFFTASLSSAFFLPDTGQTKCYNSTAKTITCPAPGQPLAQDGSYTINPPSNTVNPDGAVFDNNTWLTWQQQDDGITSTWDGAKAYCENLTLAGHNDWRLPNKRELQSIVNYGKYAPAIDLQVFPNTKSGNYWSDTLYASDTSKAWIVSFGNGSMSASADTTLAYARCVRGGPLEYDNFEIIPSIGLSNKATNLAWYANMTNAKGAATMTWADALTACESFYPYSNWRLPNIKELESLTDDTRNNPSVDKEFFTNISPSYYWTSTTNASNAGQSWAVSFQDGSVSGVKKGDRSVRTICVQTVQNNQLDSQEIKVSPSYLDFGYVKDGESKTLDLSISNTGRDILSIGSIVYPLAPFSVMYDGCSGRSLSVWESCVLTVNFLPASIGIYTDSITIPSNDLDQPNLSLNISATATANGPAFLLPDTALQYCFESLYPWLYAWYFSSCSPSQDASYNINVPNYNVLNTEVVTDLNTGLMWQRTDDGVSKRWEDAVSYCNNLNLGGYTGWRLPSRTELFSIVDYSHKGGWSNTGSPVRTLAPRVNAGAFPGAQVPSPEYTYNYWTSSESEESKAMSWAVSFVYGTSVLMNKETSQYTRCVRGGGLSPTDLSSNGNGTLTDKSTSYMWQQAEGGEMTWTNAADYCENLSLGGFVDWRLPNVKELEYICMSNEEFFPAIQSGGYWSSTTNMYSRYSTWLDSFEYAYVVVPQGGVNDRHRGFGDGEAVGLVRCVRAGNPALLADGRIIYIYPNFLDFGTITSGTSKWLSFIVYNGGTADLKINYLYIKNSPFSIASENCSGITLVPYNSCSVTVKFSPTTIGTFNSWFFVNSNDADTPYAYVNMTGMAIPTSTATLTGTVTDFSTGLPISNVSVTVTDSSSTKTTSTGSSGVYTVACLAEGGYTAIFSKTGYITQTVTGTLIAGQTQTLDIQLNPAPSLAISITSPLNGTVLNSSPVTVTGSVSNSATVTVNGVQATVSNGIFTASVSLSEGQNTITVNASDQYGQTASQSINVSLILPPVISNINVSDITLNSAKISWTTSQPSSTLFEFGTTTAYGNVVTDPALTTSYTVTLSGLSQSTTYHYKITATNAQGISSSSGDQTFKTLAPAFIAATLGDYGNVTVMEVAGNYDAKKPDGTINDMPRQEIAKEFYRNHQDQYDFFVIFSNFDFSMPDADAKAFYLEVKNDTQGLGKPVFDNSNLYGSSRLQGIIDMGNTTHHGLIPSDPNFEETLYILSHEQMHRWGATVKFKDSNGNTSTALLGKDGSHWSFLLDSDASVLYGNDWKDNANSTFTSTGGWKYYSPLDLYLAGLYDKSQVPQMLLIDNPLIDPNKLPEVGATITGVPRYITINDIIAAEGERIPNAASSQKAFKTAFILITRPGTFTGNELPGIENIRNAWAGKFATLTNGKGSISDVTPNISIAISSPLNGDTINRPDVTVKGAIINSTGNETGVTVNGIVATIYGNQFMANVPLFEGQNTITVTATDTDGNTASTSITVNAVTTGNYIRLSSNIESGIAPLEVVLKIDGSFSIAESSLNVVGPVQPEITLISPDEYMVKFIVEGIYYITASAIGPDGLTYQDMICIIVMNKIQMDNLLKGKWEGMKEALMNQDIEGATGYFNSAVKEKYERVFSTLRAHLPEIASNMNHIKMDYVTGDVAEYRIGRIENIDGQMKEITYFIYFIKDGDGLWKIESL